MTIIEVAPDIHALEADLENYERKCVILFETFYEGVQRMRGTGGRAGGVGLEGLGWALMKSGYSAANSAAS